MINRVFRKILTVSKRLRSRFEVYMGRARVQCNICQHRDISFDSDLWHKNIICPNCYCSVRHRLFYAAITYLPSFSSERLLKEKKVLHFAPEKVISRLLKPLCGQYHTADLIAEGYAYDDINYNIDISDLSIIESNTYNTVVAFDVLEHVEAHIRAMEEIYRVLALGGVAILTVPQKDGLSTTFEDPSLITPQEREKFYGQWDHLRIYGGDFTEMLASVGFKVSEVNENSFDRQVAETHVLFPPVLSKHPLATNYRKIYFAQK